MKKLILSVVFMLFSISLFAGGYRVALQGARMLGMAHAGTAMTGNAEVMFFNPSASAFLEGDLHFSFGLSLVMSKVKYQNETYLWTAQTENPIGTPFYAYLSYKQNEKFYFGLAVYTPFGNSLKWQDGWAGAHLVNRIALKAIYFQPTMTYKFNDYFSASVSFISATGSVVYNKDVNRFLTGENGEKTDITLEAKGITAAGYAFGFTIRPDERVSLGLNYRSKILFKARNGKAVINDRPAYFPENDAFSAVLPMPAELSVGLAVSPLENLTLAFDLNRTYWSVYESLDIDFKTKLPDNSMKKNWDDTFTYRFGMQYQFGEKLTLRGGYYYDQSPIPATYFSPETPSLNSDNYTFGFTYKYKKYEFDFALLYVNGKERTDSYLYYKEGMGSPVFEGTYVSNAIVPSFGFNIKL
jgi:long-chain fatty acid transport protein